MMVLNTTAVMHAVSTSEIDLTECLIKTKNYLDFRIKRLKVAE